MSRSTARVWLTPLALAGCVLLGTSGVGAFAATGGAGGTAEE
jgi:hypothetical protein